MKRLLIIGTVAALAAFAVFADTTRSPDSTASSTATPYEPDIGFRVVCPAVAQ